jgi:hypothetical protein
MARIFFFTCFSAYGSGAGDTPGISAANETLNIKEITSIGNAKHG